MHTYFVPMLQRPQMPTPHFMRFSRVVRMFSSSKPSFFKACSVNLIMIGGPQVMATVFLGEGLISSSTLGMRPTLCSQPSDGLSMVSTVFTSLRSVHSGSSAL